MDDLADTKFRITWPCFTETREEEKVEEARSDYVDDNEKPGKKDRNKKRKKKKKPPAARVCSMCRLGPAGAARSSVRRAALWCCTRCCLMCCTALRVVVAVLGVVAICLAAFYILSPSENKSSGSVRIMRAGLRALGARARGGPRAQSPSPVAAVPLDLRNRGGAASTELPFQPVTTECGPDCPGGETDCPGGRPDCPGGGPDGSDCGPECPGSKADCLGQNKDSPDIEVLAGPFPVVESSVIVSPHDTAAAALDEPVGVPSSAASPDGVNDDNVQDCPSSSCDLQGRSGSDVPDDPED